MNTVDFSSGADPAGIESAQLEKRRQLAELLMQQSVSGGPVYSKQAGIARALTGLLSGMETGSVDRRQKELAQTKDDERRADLQRIADMAQAPYLPAGAPQKDDEGNDMPGSAAKTGASRMELAKALLMSRNPQMSQFGMQQLFAKPEKPEAYTLKPGETRYQGGQVVAQAPKEPDKEPDSVRALKAEMVSAGIDPDSDMGKKIFKAALDKSTTHQPAPSVTVNTDKKFGQVLASQVAEQVAQSADAARGAMDTLNTAKQIESAIASGKVMAGPGTSGIMLVQQAIGAPSSQEGLVQTRQVIQGLSQMTLNSRKQLKGQGAVSDFEGRLLERAASGDIDRLTVPEIQSLVKTATRLANGAITQHKSYLDKIKADPDLKNLAPFFDFQVPAAGSNPNVDDLVKKYGG